MEINNKDFLNTKNIANPKILKFLQEFYNCNGENINIKQLPKNSASDRVYYRLFFEDGSTQILAYTENFLESETFLYFSDELCKNTANVPKVFFNSKDNSIYTIQDLGSVSLFDLINNRKSDDLPQNVLNYCLES